ncbi:nitroreductase family deazaflavin-dependent oxidoreductase [Mycolicibacterium vinylchloridicum]|uniref:nitroreductase family deazaflavin-dependent oxidoreductase n=1 Tax=Mycolicibacterium vinylchloridicum TaxID=2736928 RepID=UPI0015CB2C64|nr:nitroreductase family deazaflavin-dependent oxidoreductase [Mycolicibacterium vinylchloridicum]
MILPRLFRIASRAHVMIYRRTGGRVGAKWRIGAGFRRPVPTLLLEHTGRRSGKTFVVPLLYIEDGPEFVVVASQGGRAEHPQWFRNLLVNPDTRIQIGRHQRSVQARTADPTERARLWPLMVSAYADLSDYQSWTDREIPLVILTPAGAAER